VGGFGTLCWATRVVLSIEEARQQQCKEAELAPLLANISATVAASPQSCRRLTPSRRALRCRAARRETTSEASRPMVAIYLSTARLGNR
jgi:hypothetical protein